MARRRQRVHGPFADRLCLQGDLEAEATLEELGWHAGELSSLEVATGANTDRIVPILPGRVLWERIALSDGRAGRIVTTIA